MPTHQQTNQRRQKGAVVQKKPQTDKMKTVNPLAGLDSGTWQGAELDPEQLSAAGVLQLQRTIGNRAVSRLVAGAVPFPQRPTKEQGDHGEQELITPESPQSGGPVQRSTGSVIQRKIGPDKKIGQYVKRQPEGDIFKIVKVNKKGGKWSYRVQSEEGGHKIFVRENDKNYSITDQLPIQTLKSSVSPPIIDPSIVPVDKSTPPLPEPVKPPEQKAAEALASFDVVNLIDHASTGTGHQAAMFALINNLATLKYKGEIHLTYFGWKTKFWSGKFNVPLSNSITAYQMYTAPWSATYKELNIICKPLGVGQMSQYNNLIRNFKTALKTPPSTDKEVQELFWEKIWWDGAPGCAADDLKFPNGAGKKWKTGESAFQDTRKTIEGYMAEWSIAETPSFGEALSQIPEAPKRDKKDKPKTLTMFAALDSPELGKDMVDLIRKMTGEEEPLTVVLQPFLWANEHHASPRVMQGEKVETDIQETIGKGNVPVYPQQIANTDNIDAFVEAKEPSSPNKEKVKSILNKAKSNTINLISAYYTQASASDVPYDKLLKVLIAAMQHRDMAGEKPTVLALLGNEALDAHTKAFDALEIAQKTNVSLSNDTIYNDLSALRGKIVLEHVGRTMTMPLFERLSLFFVTEGANTWQETLSVGKPSLSARPTGETQPWTQDMGLPEAAKMVKEASEALVDLAKVEDGTDLQSRPEILKLVNFIKSVRDDQHSDVNKYFQKWSEALSSPEGNQVVTALSSIHSVLKL